MAVAESEADGYTLMLANTSTLIVAPLIYRNVSYDPERSFAPVALLGTTSNLLIVHPALPVRSVAELVALARAKPGKLNYASAGIGTPPHLVGETFKQKVGIDVAHVPYKGGGSSLQATVAGETQYSFENPASALPLAEAGAVRALAVSSPAVAVSNRIVVPRSPNEVGCARAAGGGSAPAPRPAESPCRERDPDAGEHHRIRDVAALQRAVGKEEPEEE